MSFNHVLAGHDQPLFPVNDPTGAAGVGKVDPDGCTQHVLVNVFGGKRFGSGRLGGVIFADTGYVGEESFIDGSGSWHAGAGIGLRYATTLGPIRVDAAWPVSGDTGEGMQLYFGIGQAF